MRVDKTKWEKKTFSQIGISQLGKTLDSKRNKGKSYPYLCAVNVGYGNFHLTNVKEILMEENELERYQVLRGDLLICEGGETGRCAIWESDDIIYYQNALHRIRFNEGINNYFIMYALHYYKKVGIIDRLSHGQTIKHFTQKGLNQLVFHIPPIKIQQVIASELDAIQKMIDGYKAQLEDLDALAQSMFLDMFGDPVTNPKGWEKLTLKELTVKMSTGPFGSMLHKEDYDIDGIPSINPQDLKGNRISVENIALVNYNKAQELNRYILHTNDIVIARRGDLSKCAIITQSENGWLCGTGSFFLSLKKLTPILFYYLYTSKSVQKYLNDKCIGATMPNLNQGILSYLKLPLPPLSLQQQFASKIEAIEKQKEQIRLQLADAETLMAERMQYYFS